MREVVDVMQPAPPPSPIFPDINKNNDDVRRFLYLIENFTFRKAHIFIDTMLQKPRKQRPKLENTKRMEKKKTKRETLQVRLKLNRSTIISL